MRITPLDIRKQDFRKVMRGYEPEEVQAFLTTVADEYEAVLLDNKQLRERILELDEKIQEYRHMEKTLRDTLMTAERVLAEAKDNARKEAELILKDAEMRSQQSLEGFRRLATDLRREVVDLHKEKEGYLARFRGLAEAQIQFIANHQTDFEELDRRLLELAQPRPQAGGAGGKQSRPEESAPAEGGAGSTPSAGPSRAAATAHDQWRDYEPGQPLPAARSRASGLAPEDVDELLEPLAEVEQTLAHLRDEARDEAPSPPASAPPADGEQAPRERSEVWNMESFTRGLSDL